MKTNVEGVCIETIKEDDILTIFISQGDSMIAIHYVNLQQSLKDD